MELTSTVPDCNDPNSGSIATEAVGYSGPIELDWGGADPDMVAAGEYRGGDRHLRLFRGGFCRCGSADIPEDLELNGSASVVQGDSAAYYYEYTLAVITLTYTGQKSSKSSIPSPFH